MALGMFLVFGATVQAANVGIGSQDRAHAPVTSFRAMRDANVVRQRFDYSCGAAALATILRYGFGEAVTERDILLELFALLPDEEEASRREQGFSLLDLQRVAQARGYKAEGFRLAPEFLSKLGGPVIVFIKPHGYKHFAVLRGTRGDRVYLADPSRGNIRMPGYSFLETWLDENGEGIIFVVEPKIAPPARSSVLAPPEDRLPQPEILSVRELLAVGSAIKSRPNISR